MPVKSNKSSEIEDQSEMSCQKQCYFFYEKFSQSDFCFEDVVWNFNQGQLLTRKTSNGTKQNKFLFLNYHIIKALINMCTSLLCN